MALGWFVKNKEAEAESYLQADELMVL